MNPISLFTSISGRINRAKWWIGMIVAYLVLVVGSVLVHPGSLAAYTDPEALLQDPNILKPSLPQLIFQLIMIFPMFAVVMKRLNDRDWPSWLGYLLGAIFVGTTIGQYFALQGVQNFLDPVEVFSATAPYSITTGVVFLFLLIDNGMLKGTVGSNQYGEDPLAHTHTDVA